MLLKAITFWTITACVLLAGACAAQQPGPLSPVTDDRMTQRPAFQFSPQDEKLLDEVQHGAFLYLWECVEEPVGMVRDRSSKPVVSVAGVGFQLAGIPVGVERGWITREQGNQRVLSILRALTSHPGNRKAGVYFHYLNSEGSGPSADGYEVVASTIDGALLTAGVIVAGEYFGGEARSLAERMVAEIDWSFFLARGGRFKPSERDFISLAWQPRNKQNDPTGEGELLPYVWMDAGDEQRLVSFLAVCAPVESHRVDPSVYYRLRRRLGSDDAGPPFVWFPWSGALFTNFFAQCFIDYAHMKADDPSAAGIERRPSVDWWVNARRAVAMHRRKSLDDAGTGFRPWGLSASDAPSGYEVPGLFPKALPTTGLKPDFDFHPGDAPADNTASGCVAPYAAGCSIMFEPRAAVEALRAYKSLKNAEGGPLVWREPKPGSRAYGFLDSFNLTWKDQQGRRKPWSATDCVAIDQGPLLLAIENARTGLIWRHFHHSAAVRAGMERLKLSRDADDEAR